MFIKQFVGMTNINYSNVNAHFMSLNYQNKNIGTSMFLNSVTQLFFLSVRNNHTVVDRFYLQLWVELLVPTNIVVAYIPLFCFLENKLM